MPAAKYLDSEGLAYLWGKIKTYVGDSIETGNADLANKIHFVVPDQKSSTTALTATIDGIAALSPGLVVAMRMPFDNMASSTLNINSLGAKPLYYKNSVASAGMFPNGTVVLLVYETTTVATGCFKAVYSYNADTHYTTKFVAGSTSTTMNNSTSDTSNDSTYLVVNDISGTTTSMSRYGVKVTGTGSTTVSAKDGTLTINSEVAPEYAPVETSTIDVLFDGGEAFADKSCKVTNFGLRLFTAEDGSVAGINEFSYWYMPDNEITIQSNTDYVFTNDPFDVEDFDRPLLTGLKGTLDAKDEDGGNSRFYGTIGNGITGYGNSEYQTWSGVYVWAESDADNVLDESDYWGAIPFDRTAINGDGISFYLNMTNTSEMHEGGHLVTSSDGKFKVTLFKMHDDDLDKDVVCVKLRWICTE